MVKKHILIAVCGLTPQVITETLYYFYKIRKQPISEVHVVTTLSGKEEIKKKLFEGGILAKLRNKLQIKNNFTFTEDTICLVTDSNGNPLEDIRTIEHNERIAEILWDVVAIHTDRENVVVHCSIAGGRKTMGVYAGLIMSLLGRKNDTLSHILVDEKKESSDFYFPLNEDDERKLSLAEIPYIRLREISNIGEKKLNFVKRIQDYQKELDKRVVLKELKIIYEDKMLDGGNCGKVKLSEREFFIYSMLSERRRQCTCKNGCSNCFLDISTVIDEIPKQYERFNSYFPSEWRDKGYEKQDIREIFTRIKEKIDNSDFYKKDLIKIGTFGAPKNYKYGINLSRKKIKPVL